MSTASPTHLHFPGSAVMAAVATAIFVGGVAALAMVLPQGESTQPVAPTTECTITSCHAGHHPVLPGRHELRKHAGRELHLVPDGAPAAPGRP
jgi:hypothetical protein